MASFEAMQCPYLDYVQAIQNDANYFCMIDNMEFDSMHAHCKYCEMYENMIKAGMRKIFGVEK